MPVWETRFKMLDPVHDPTHQQHIDDVVAYTRLAAGEITTKVARSG